MDIKDPETSTYYGAETATRLPSVVEVDYARAQRVMTQQATQQIAREIIERVNAEIDMIDTEMESIRNTVMNLSNRKDEFVARRARLAEERSKQRRILRESEDQER